MVWMMVFAADIDTPAGTTLQSNVTVDYEDPNGVAMPQQSDSVQVTVSAIYGLQWVQTPTNGETGPSQPIYYVFKVSNEGNTTDNLTLSLSAFTYTGNSGSAWSAQIIQDDDQDGIHDSTETTAINSLTIGEDEDLYFFVEVTPSADAEFNSTGTLTITVTSSGSDGDEYTGDNGNTYGGPDSIQFTFTTTACAPLIHVATSQDITLAGSSSSPVPGATVKYTVFYDNDGNRAADNVVIVMDIDPNTVYKAGSAGASPNTGATVTIEFYDGTAWSTSEPADPSTVQQIRWTIDSVAADNSSTDTGDTSSTADGTNPDDDAGNIYFEVYIK